MQALLYSSSSIVTVSSTFSSASARSLTFSVTKKSCRRALSVPSWYISHKELSPFKLLAWTVKQTHPPPMSASSVSAGRTWSPKLLKNWPIDSQLTKISAKVSAFRLTRSHVFKGTSENKIEKKKINKKRKVNFEKKSPTKFQSKNERFLGYLFGHSNAKVSSSTSSSSWNLIVVQE